MIGLVLVGVGVVALNVINYVPRIATVVGISYLSSTLIALVVTVALS